MKTTTKIGIIVILVGIAALFISGSLVNGQIGREILSVNVTASPHSFGYAHITTQNASSMLFLTMAMSNQTNLYVFNATAFEEWSAYAQNRSANGWAYATKLDSTGRLYTYANATFVQLALANTTGTNSSRGYSSIYNGSYYVV
ncbi:MAG: hypothetical protein KGH66_01800, partial [Candidatus Micrarchaeota archaeon]|nr:hypothetical protein [Candidatus Micrarchaeota archaeon]